MFDVTTKRPQRQSCSRYCDGFIAVLCQGARRAEARKRMSKWKGLAVAASRQGRITLGDLVDMCQKAYLVGYQAGRASRIHRTK